MKKLIIFTAVLFLLVPLFAGGKKDYDWASSVQQQYSDSEYFTAVGTGLGRASAESNAKMALSQILGESINAEQVTTYSADSLGAEEGTISSVINEKAVFDHITGIVIKETFTDSKTNTWYALAVLNKKEAGNYYYAKVTDANTHVTSLLSKAEAAKGTMDSLTYLKSALEAAEDNEYNLDLLLVINPVQGKMARVMYQSPASIRAKRTELAAAIRVRITVKGDSEASQKRIYAAFAGALGEQGVTVVPETDPAVTHAILAELFFEPAESPDPAYTFVRYYLNAVLSELSSSEEIPYSVTGREGHMSESQAKNRAVFKIESQIKENYMNTIAQTK